MSLALVANVVEKALARLISQFDDSLNVRSFIEAVVGPFQEIENAIWQLQTLRGLDTAEGAQLDGLGEILQFKRQGLDDDTYRRFLKAMMKVYASSGTIPEFIDVFRELFPAELNINGIRYIMLLEFPPANFILAVQNVAIPDELVPLVYNIAFQQMRMAGVDMHLHYTPGTSELLSDPELVFCFDGTGLNTTPGEPWFEIFFQRGLMPGLGWEDLDNPSVPENIQGGAWVSVI